VDRDELTQANSLMTLSQQMIFVVGYAVAGLMIALIGVFPMFTIDAITFLVSVTAIALLRLTPEQAHPAKARARARAAAAGDMPGAGAAGVDRVSPDGKKPATLTQELVEGFRFIGRNRAMMAVMPLAIVLNFVAAPLGVLMPAWVKDVLKTGAGMFGFLETASTAGMALGALGVGLLVTRFRRSALILTSLILQGGSILVFSMTRGAPLPLASMALMGFVNSVTNVIFNTWVQTVVPREMMGRIFGTMGTVSNIAAPAGQALAGVLGGMMPLPVLFGGVGVIFALFGTVYAMVPLLRQAFDLIELETDNGAEAPARSADSPLSSASESAPEARTAAR
jgi:hypothetical protein